MRKLTIIMLAAAAFALAGCDKGGTGDQYNTSSGTTNSASGPSPNSPRSTATSPGGVSTNSSSPAPR